MLLTQKVAVVFKFVDASGRQVLTELSGSISECEAASNILLNMLGGGTLALSRTSAAVPKAGRTRGSSGAGGAS